MGKFLDFFIEKEVDPYMEAYNAEKAEDFAKAAEIYREMAEDELSNNLYTFARYCGLSAIAYLKAKMAGEAKEQIKRVLETFTKSKDLSRENFNPQYLLKIILDMYDEGFTKESEIFLSQFNQKLIEVNCPFRIEFVPPKLMKVECPSCEAMIQFSLEKNSKCPYCDSVIAKK